jgi:hypothetical protein
MRNVLAIIGRLAALSAVPAVVPAASRVFSGSHDPARRR